MTSVLIVEDEPDGQEVLGTLLQFGSIESVQVGTAEAALDTLGQNADFAGVIIDIALPGMSGIELLKAIRQDERLAHLPCIAVPAYHTSSVRHEALEAGFDAYFPKPLDDRTFIQEVAHIIGV